MTRTTTTLLVAIVLALIGAGIYVVTSPDATDTDSSETAALESSEATTNTDADNDPQDYLEPGEPVIEDTQTVSTNIQPNTVVERVEYNLPRNHEGVLSVVVEVDESRVVESLEYEHQDVEEESISHHNQFDQSLNTEDYVGVPLDDIEDVFISGASLTSAAFNTAIENLQNRL